MNNKSLLKIEKLLAALLVMVVLLTSLSLSVNAAYKNGVTTLTIKETIQTKQLTPYFTTPNAQTVPKGVVPGGTSFDAVGLTSNGFYMVKCGAVYYYLPVSFCISLTKAQNNTNAAQQTAQTTTHGKVYEVSEADFKKEVLDYEGFVLVDFYAEWCGPCMNMKPSIEKIAKEHPEFKIVEVNVDYADNLCYQYGISSIPALFCFKNGELKYNTVGGRSEKDLLKLINTYK